MSQIIIYTSENCPYCRLAKDLLNSHGIAFEEIRVDLDDKKREEMIQLSHRRTVPQIFIHNKAIGGFDDLKDLIKSGKLNTLLNQSSE